MAKGKRNVYIVSDWPVMMVGLQTIIDQQPDLKVAAASGDGTAFDYRATIVSILSMRCGKNYIYSKASVFYTRA